MSFLAEKELIIKGRVFSGLGEGKFFTQLSWVQKQFKEKLNFAPYPGTLNLRIEEEKDFKKLEKLKKNPGIAIVPEDKTFCAAKCFKAILKEKIEAALVFPEVSNYPSDQVEIIAPYNLKEILALKDGDVLSLKIKQ